MQNKKIGSKTMLMSILISAPGPLMAGIGLLFGSSATQIAHFVRKCTHIVGLIVAYITYLITINNNCYDEQKKKKLECISNIFVGTMTCVGGVLMLLMTVSNSDTDKGNVVIGLIMAMLGTAINILLWRKYKKSNNDESSSILKTQTRLYRTKILVDVFISITLLLVVLFPTSIVSHYLDLGVSVVMSLCIIWCGVKTIVEPTKESNKNDQVCL